MKNPIDKDRVNQQQTISGNNMTEKDTIRLTTTVSGSG
jgi:hypothetical protein